MIKKVISSIILIFACFSLNGESFDISTKPDGWASYKAPSKPGGYGAGSSSTYTVTNKVELINALNSGGSKLSAKSKIIYIDGIIDLCADDKGELLDADFFIEKSGLSDKYSSYKDYMEKYSASSTPGVKLSTLESDREVLFEVQKEIVELYIGSNTTIIGIGSNSGFKNGNIRIKGVSNIVIRNLSITDAYDYFPSWDGRDNGTGLFNSEYDNIVIEDSTYVWIDHSLLSDGLRPDESLEHVKVSDGTDRKWVTHDGLLDVKKGSNYVTISWNIVENHNKTMLFGHSDSASSTDLGKLRVTMHHNYFRNTNQRTPRVRFGSVHIYNNLYEGIGSYSIGVGDNSRIYSEANSFYSTDSSIDDLDDSKNQGYIWDIGSLNVNKTMLDSPELVGWKPSDFYKYELQSVSDAVSTIKDGAGPIK